MSRTDYERIAPVYDNNPNRHQQPREDAIEHYLAARRGRGTFRVLDLACGSGNYLQAQATFYRDRPIDWYGLDQSPAMLAVAAKKNPEIDFTVGNAEKLPYRSGFFDVITCNFAFHHFRRKELALVEVARALKPAGLFVLKNVSPEDMADDSWLYRFFPRTRAIDRARFWSKKRLVSATARHLRLLTLTTTTTLSSHRFDEVLAIAANRDMSQLSLLTEQEYTSGMQKLRAKSNIATSFYATFAVLRCVAMRRTADDA